MAKSEKVKQWLLRKFVFKWKESVFRKHLLLMIVMLALFILVLLAYERIAQRNLSSVYMESEEKEFAQSCEDFAGSLYMTYAIPKAIEETKYYGYISKEKGDSLPVRYASVLPRIREALVNQMYLQGTNRECFLYFPNSNSIVCQRCMYLTAEDCFEDYLRFCQMEEEVLEQMRKGKQVTLLPMQEVIFDTDGRNDWENAQRERCMMLLIQPADSPILVMSAYTEDMILRALGVDTLPEGSRLLITDSSGTVLERYLKGETASGDGTEWEWPEEKGYEIETELKHLGATAKLWIPEAYFYERMAPSRGTGRFLISLVAVMGFLLCVLLSEISTRSTRKLAASYDGEKRVAGSDEIDYLSGLIESAQNERGRLRKRLTSTNLARALSGEALSGEDELQLQQNIRLPGRNYQVAIVHTSNEVNEIIKPILVRRLSENYYCEIINGRETGVLFPGGEREEALFRKVLEEVREELLRQNEELFCGISGLGCDFPAGMSAAVRQANAAMPKKSGIESFAGDVYHYRSVTHQQYEQLSRCLMANDEESALKLLDDISQEAYRGSTAQEMFYSIRFILRSAAAELGVFLPGLDEIPYQVSRLPGENIAGLKEAMLQLFALIQSRQAGEQQKKGQALLAWMEENYADDGLCAALAAEYFGTSEKWVYAVIRKEKNSSFNAYLLSIRMKNAARLLYTTDCGTREVAQQCGYQAESTFYRVFKRYFGKTPTEFRKDGGGGKKEEKKSG